ncbi:MAG: FMN-binding protein [Candidatus Doudnabacteria bacterium]|nr:FMN-binding protein [Candidatus Doudnabacteria bacterium]
MKKYLLSGSMVVLFILHLFYQRGLVKSSSVASSTASTTTSSAIPITVPLTPSSSTPAAAVKVAIQNGQYKDGSYTGSIADAYYGNIQVSAVIQNGKLTDVQFLQYPNDQRESIQINSRAMPLLKSEAISAQSANVNIVSRATDTSNAFRESLAAALARAKV